MQIDVQNLQKRIPLKPNLIASRVRKILRYEGVIEARLSVTFVSDQRIKALNQKYLHAHYATDVLAFDFSSNKSHPRKRIFGEIVISTGAVCRQAKIFKNSNERELTLYVIHGILHLLGFDDHRPKDIKKMRREEEKLLELIKVE